MSAKHTPLAPDKRAELAMQRIGDLLAQALGPKHEALDDWAHVMFALRAQQAPAHVTLTDAQIEAAVDAWFSLHDGHGSKFRERMRAAFAAAGINTEEAAQR